MDVVVPVRPTRPVPDHLKWVVRSWGELFPTSRLILVGSRPDWAKPDVVIPTYQVYSKFLNIGANMVATLASDVTDQFVWLNDDFFLLHSITEVPLTNKGPWDQVIDKLGVPDPKGPREHQDYVNGFRSQRDIIREWGFDTSTEPCTDLHTPFPVDKGRMIEVLGRTQAEHPEHQIGHFRGLYGAGLPSTYMADVKIKKPDRLPESEWWTVSTSLTSWQGACGEFLRTRFSTKSRWEK